MQKYKLAKAGASIFPVSTVFVDELMPKANATFVKVYLYGLRCCHSGSVDIDNAQVAKTLDILESDVVKAWRYWEEVGAVKLHFDENTKQPLVEFLDLSEQKSIRNGRQEQPQSTVGQKPEYSFKEIRTLTEQDRELSDMFKLAQQLLSKPLTPNETTTLYSFYDWLSLPCSVIIMMIEHCVSIGKPSMRYIEKVALSWAEQGIDTVKKAEQYIKQKQEQLSTLAKYKKMFGISDRELSDTEKKTILKWVEEMKVSEELIKEAYEKTVLFTGKFSIPYMNKILHSWFEKGIDTVDKARDEGKPTSRKKVTKFSDYTQTGKYDLDLLEKLSIEKLSK